MSIELNEENLDNDKKREKDPRGDGEVLDDRGQPNVIDYSNREPMLYEAGENSSHQYPGKIVTSNEPKRDIDREVSKKTIPGPAESGKESVGSNTTQPGLTTGAPQEQNNNNPAAHGLNFNDKVEFHDQDPIELESEEVEFLAPDEEPVPIPEGIADNEKLLYTQIVNATKRAQENQNSATQSYEERMHLPNEKSDTGDDDTRTGPEGNVSKDDNNATWYQGSSDTKIHGATGMEMEGDEAKQIHDVDGTIPELRDDESKKKPLTFEINEAVIPQEYENNKTQSFTHSSYWVGNVSYRRDTLQMDVTMNGRSYTHCGVSLNDFEQFRDSPSKGQHWHTFIKDNFNCSGPKSGKGAMSEALILSKDRKPNEFDWIDDNAIEEMIKYSKNHGKGKFLLVVLSGETITDHRPEGRGEIHRRRWGEQELIQNIRTAKGKMVDINHMFQKKDMQSGGVYDANWNFKTHRGEAILWETDEEILDAIRNDIIDAVSIHTGLPRTVKTNCEDGECFIEPQGTILGEQDNIALTYVVTHPDGFRYNGMVIPPFPPGMKFTKIYLVE